jgi:hypothetical protein
MISNYLRKNISKKILKLCFKFVFLTKKFKERNERDVLEFFINAMIMSIKIHNILILLKFQIFWNLINVFIKIIYEKINQCFLFLKVQWV